MNSAQQLTNSSPYQRQCGAVLFVSLIILLLMTIIGVSAMQNTTMQEKMAGNLRDANLAFQAAESALRDAENYIANTASLPIFASDCGSASNSNNGLCLPIVPSSTSYQQWENVSYWSNADKTRCYGAGTNAAQLSLVSKQPRYMAEEIAIPPLDPTEPPDIRYRITAQGYGGAATNQPSGSGRCQDTNVSTLARVMLQSTYKK